MMHAHIHIYAETYINIYKTYFYSYHLPQVQHVALLCFALLWLKHSYGHITRFDIWHVATLLDINTLTPRQNGRHFPDDIFKCIFLNESAWISIEISLEFVPKGPINNIPALFK